MTKLKIGDKVVMNDRYYDKHQGEVFTIKAGPEMVGRKECFWLDGYDGAYCADGLDLYKPQTNEEWRKTCPAEEFAEWMAQYCCDVNTSDVKEILKNEWVEWLKQPHKPFS